MSDAEIQALAACGDTGAATKLLVETYGSEVFGYVTSLLKDEDMASDAFAGACENVLKSIGSFRGEASVRTWFYAIARHAAFREHRRQRRRRVERISGLEAQLQAPVRTVTAQFCKTEVKDEIAKLREALTDEERELLLLRIDRGLSWLEIAAVCLSDGHASDPEQLKREAARCRKQFERAKSKLRELAERAGLLPGPGAG